MSYAWTGAPAVFNGTDPITGGDSGKYPQVLLCYYARAERAQHAFLRFWGSGTSRNDQ